MWDKLLAAGQTPGFWRGITYFVTSAGIALEPSQVDAIIALGLAVVGAIHVFWPHKEQPK